MWKSDSVLSYFEKNDQNSVVDAVWPHGGVQNSGAAFAQPEGDCVAAPSGGDQKRCGLRLRLGGSARCQRPINWALNYSFFSLSLSSVFLSLQCKKQNPFPTAPIAGLPAVSSSPVADSLLPLPRHHLPPPQPSDPRRPSSDVLRLGFQTTSTAGS